MASATHECAVAPLTRKTRDGGVLRRPAEIEAEIARALAWSDDEILTHAAATTSEERMSEECMVHLIRRDLKHRSSSRQRSSSLAEGLMPLLLARCDAGLKGSIRGFPPSSAVEAREEVLGRLAVSLAGSGNEADFFEVRFALALKRLRIDVCRRERRRLHGLVTLDDVSTDSVQDESLHQTLDRTAPSPPNQEDRLLIRQALATLTPEERKILVLHKLAGVPLSSKITRRSGTGAPSTTATLVGLLGRSERTLRNRLRSAEAKLVDFREDQR